MSLNKNSYITASDFNELKNSIANEVLRRAKRSNFPSSGQINSLGNDYNQNTFSIESNIPIKNSLSDIITEEYFQKILNFFKNFYYNNPTKYPSGLNSSYTDDDDINIGDIIYAINQLTDNYLPTLETTSTSETGRQNNNDCRSNCMGLCTDNCKNQCTSCLGCTSCTGCTGCDDNCTAQCMTSCDTGCQGGCKNGCGGQCSSSCWSDSCYSLGCSGQCADTCGESCSGSCRYRCGDDCEDTCQSCAANCNSNCSGSCSSTCANSCFTGNRLQ